MEFPRVCINCDRFVIFVPSSGSLPPPSPSCNPYTPAANVPLTPFAVYGQSNAATSNASPVETNVFFPQNMPATPHSYYTHHQPQPTTQQQQTPHTPISHPSYYSVPQPQQQQPLYFQYHTIQPAVYSNVTPVTPSHHPAAAAAQIIPSSSNTTALQQQQQHVPRRAARR